MDSPHSEKSQTRFSTPVSELDDHRDQPSSLPRAEMSSSMPPSGAHTRRGTDRDNSAEEPPRLRQDLLQINEELERARTTTRDFEQAVLDEDIDTKSVSASLNGVAQDDKDGQRGSFSPAIGRRGTTRRSQNQEAAARSRSSSKSSRSVSPPNSVDAFADPRRRDRAGTINSRAASELDVGLNRSISGGTHTRRPTFSEGTIGLPEICVNIAGELDSAEEDVCFPQPEESHRAWSIDFEPLNEFVAEKSQDRTPLHHHHGHKKHVQRAYSPPVRVYNDLRQNNSTIGIPAIIAHFAKPGVNDSSESAVDDKLVAEKDAASVHIEAEASFPRAPSVTEANRFSFFSSELDSTIHAAELGDLIMPGESFGDIFRLSPEGGVWWLDVYDPTEEEVNVLAKAFSIHPLTSEDIKTQETREKVELFKQYYFVCFRSFYQMDKGSEDYMDPVNVYVVVFREGVLSFTFSQSPHAANVRKRIGKLRDYVALSADWICYAMIDDIVDQFGPVIHDIEQETDVIEDQVFVARANDFNSLLRQIGECRKKVMGLMRLLGGKADVIKGFAKRCNDQYSVTPRGEIGLYLGDIQDHVVTMMSNLGHFEKMLSRSHSNYLAQLSVDSIAQGSRANEVLGKITLIATILVPMNLICGLFGMNVPVPGRESGGLGWFFGILGVIFAIVVSSLCAAKKFKFI